MGTVPIEAGLGEGSIQDFLGVQEATLYMISMVPSNS